MSKNKLGFSLIELMIAMVIGVIILLGLISLFDSSSSLNRSQHGLSVLQENGRYAITRIKQDIELAGRKHCTTVALPSTLTTDWDQGYQMTALMAAPNVTFNNGLPNISDVRLDSTAASERNQLSDSAVPAGSAYPIDPSFFIKGHDCGSTACNPAIGTSGDGTHLLAVFGDLGSEDGNRPLQTDILTVRYFTGGRDVVAIDNLTNTVTLAANQPPLFNGLGLIADCNNSLITTFNGAVANNAFPLPNLNPLSNLKLFDMNTDFRTVSYYLKLNTDPNDSNRLISSLYRSENGDDEQQIVEGVERFDLFYLAQLQTGEVARLTAAQVQGVQGGGDVDGNGTIDGSGGCIIPPRITSGLSGFGMANDAGCLWRSIYAVEVHMLLNTVNNSSTTDDDRFVYSPDGDTPQDPSTGLVSGLDGERMYRREFTAVVPIRSYTL